MDSLKSFSEPAGILTAVNTGLIIGGSLWVSNRISARHKDIDTLQEEMKKYNDQIKKMKDLIDKMDKSSAPKMTLLIEQLGENMNSINHRLMHYIKNNEEKNIIRDKNLAEVYDYMKSIKPSNVPLEVNSSNEEHVHIHPSSPIPPKVVSVIPDEDEDSDIAAIIRMASSKK